MGRLRPDEALATAHHRRPEGPEMWARPESSRGAFLPYSIAAIAWSGKDNGFPMKFAIP